MTLPVSAWSRWQPRQFIGLALIGIFFYLTATVWWPLAQTYYRLTAVTFRPTVQAEQLATSLKHDTPVSQGLLKENRLIIRSQHGFQVDAPIILGQSDDDLLRGAGLDPQSVAPGQVGRSVISAHSFIPRRSAYATLFFALDRLQVGDYIDTYYQGQHARYQVYATWLKPKDQALSELSASTEPILTLYTCSPVYTSKQRRGIHARLDQSARLESASSSLETLSATWFN